MSYQVISSMAYNARTGKIETWQHSNNVWPKDDYFREIDANDEKELFLMIKWVAEKSWQTRKWKRQFEKLFLEYPELVMESYEEELKGKTWEAYCAIIKKYEDLAESRRSEIVARFKELTKIN